MSDFGDIRRVCAAGAGILALAVLLGGWGLGLFGLSMRGAVTMPSSALCGLALAVALLLKTNGEGKPGVTAQVAAIFAVVLAGANVIVRLSLNPHGLDSWLPIPLGANYAMSYGTSIAVLFAAIGSGALLPRLPEWLRSSMSLLMLSTLLGVLLSKLAHLDDIPLFEEMSLMTVVMMTLILAAAAIPSQTSVPSDEPSSPHGTIFN